MKLRCISTRFRRAEGRSSRLHISVYRRFAIERLIAALSLLLAASHPVSGTKDRPIFRDPVQRKFSCVV
jgi:hypothetical protein